MYQRWFLKKIEKNTDWQYSWEGLKQPPPQPLMLFYRPNLTRVNMGYLGHNLSLEDIYLSYRVPIMLEALREYSKGLQWNARWPPTKQNMHSVAWAKLNC